MEEKPGGPGSLRTGLPSSHARGLKTHVSYNKINIIKERDFVLLLKFERQIYCRYHQLRIIFSTASTGKQYSILLNTNSILFHNTVILASKPFKTKPGLYYIITFQDATGIWTGNVFKNTCLYHLLLWHTGRANLVELPLLKFLLFFPLKC